MAKQIVFIESNITGSGERFLEESSELGFQPVVICQNRSRYPGMKRLPVEVVEVDTLNQEAIVAELRGRPVLGVLTTSDYFSEMQAKVAAELGLPGPNLHAVQRWKNKRAQRESLRASGVAQPLYKFCLSAQEASEVEMAPPLVMKPVQGTGKVGVKLVRTREELEKHALVLEGMKTNQRGAPIDRGFLVEEFIVGKEYSVEVFDGAAIGVTEKSASPPHFIEEGHVYPADVPAETYSTLTKTAEQAASALGLDYGPAHVELRLCGPDAPIMEVNARLAGGNIPSLVSLATGVDLIKATILRAIGKKPQLAKTRENYAAIRFVVSKAPGKVSEVDLSAPYSGCRGVVDVRVYVGVGDVITVHGDFRDRLAHAIAIGTTASVAMERARAAAENVVIKLEEKL